MPETAITPIAIVVVRRGDDVLIGQRPPGVPLAGYWEFPGGKVLPGELPEEAARRECREETGLDVEIGDVLVEVEHAYAHGRLRLSFYAAALRTAPTEPEAPFRWVPLAELNHFVFPPANAAVLELLGK